MARGATEGSLQATARWTAAVRAAETRREDRLFADPWAEALAGEAGTAWLAGRPVASLAGIVLRTRFFDDFLARVAQEDGVRQLVLLGAGLDTRAYRLRWPEGTRLFELDHGAVLAEKQRILDGAGARPGCSRSAIAADLTGDWEPALRGAGFAPSSPSAWLLEGLLFYLDDETGLRLLDGASRLAAPGSALGLDVVNGAMLASPLTRAWVEMQAALGAPWIGTMDRPLEALGARGWEASLTQAGQPDANHGRWPFPVFPVDRPELPHNWFVTARKPA